MRYRELPPHRMPQYEDEIVAGKVNASAYQFIAGGLKLSSRSNRDEFDQHAR